MLVGIEADADFHYLAAVGEVRLGIAAGIDLLKGMAGSVAHLQLHDIDGIGHEDDHVGAAARHLHLRTHIDVEHGEDQVEGVFVEPFFCLSLGELLLEALHVGNAGEIGLHVLHGQVDVALLECSPEF